MKACFDEHEELQTDISTTVQCLPFEQCGTINCRLTSVPQFSACPLSKVAQLAAHSHKCHSSVPTLWAMWHNQLQIDISATLQCLHFEQCGTIKCRLTSVPQFSACLRKIPHAQIKSCYCHSHVCRAQIDVLFLCFQCPLLPCWIFQAVLCWFHAFQKLFTAHHGSLDMTDI